MGLCERKSGDLMIVAKKTILTKNNVTMDVQFMMKIIKKLQRALETKTALLWDVYMISDAHKIIRKII